MTLKTAFLLVLFSASALSLRSQSGYDYTIIEYTSRHRWLSISKNGREFSLEKISKDSLQAHYNANPLLARVKLFESKGWELMGFNSQIVGRWHRKAAHFAYLRRKASN